MPPTLCTRAARRAPRPGSGLRRAALLGLLLCAALPVSGRAVAATLRVDSSADENSSEPANGTCTLREAVLAANRNLPIDGCPPGEPLPVVDLVLLTLPGEYLLSIPGTAEDQALRGDLDLTEDVTIRGLGRELTTISAGGLDRIFDVLGGSVVSLEGMRIEGGSGGNDAGGAIHVGAGGALTVLDSMVSRSVAATIGGGIASFGTLRVLNSQVSSNNASAGGGIGFTGELTLVDSTIRFNMSSFAGGGIFALGRAQLLRSAVNNNQGFFRGGGGILNNGELSLTDSSLFLNFPDAVRNDAPGAMAEVTGSALLGNLSRAITNTPSTITNVTNSTLAGNGRGAVFNGEGAQIALTNVTITDNDEFGSPGIENAGGLVLLENTILDDPCVTAPPLSQTLSQGGNLETGDSCGLVQSSDQVDVTPEQLALEPFRALHGGLTLSHALLPGSLAIDAVGPCALATDQRGFLRDAECDVGAYEFGAIAPTPLPTPRPSKKKSQKLAKKKKKKQKKEKAKKVKKELKKS